MDPFEDKPSGYLCNQPRPPKEAPKPHSKPVPSGDGISAPLNRQSLMARLRGFNRTPEQNTLLATLEEENREDLKYARKLRQIINDRRTLKFIPGIDATLRGLASWFESTKRFSENQREAIDNFRVSTDTQLAEQKKRRSNPNKSTG